MPLPLPTLDRLTFDELVSEARSSLPALAPGWTDYNAHDPGITLIELFAWLAEGSSYRLDTIPDESYRAFLRLAGVVQRPAQVAETILVFKLELSALARPMQDGIRVQSKDGAVVFQTTAALFVSKAQLQTVVSGTGTVFEDMTARNATKTTAFLPFGAKPQPGDALYLGFNEVLAPADSIVSLGVWTGNAAEDLATQTTLNAEQESIKDEAKRLCPAGMTQNQPDWRQHYGAYTVWEYYAVDGQWKSLQDVVDDTRALTLSGVVRFKAPGDQKGGGVVLTGHEGKYFIRCRLERGAYDCPPRIAYVAVNAVAARNAVTVPPQTFRSTGHTGQRIDLAQRPVVPDSITLKVTLNGVTDGKWHIALAWDGVGPHDRTCILVPEAGTLVFGDGRIGRVPPTGAEITVNYRSTGRAGQRFDLAQRPVVPDSIKLKVELNGVTDGEWHVALAWDGVGSHDRTCILVPEDGTLVFGDGRIGRVPPARAEITVNYQMGGGVNGNVAAGTLVQLAPNQPTLEVEQPFAACGGAAAETLNEAKARAVRELATPTRAVTLEDFEALAFATPGVPLARAHAIADYHPDMPCIRVSGSTTVVVLPPCPEQRPEPTAALCESVQRYLERRRVLTSEIHVVAPHYTTVAVSAHLQARAEVDRRALMSQARGALEQLFHPLKGGPDGHGWPIGRAVYRAEILALLNGLNGVLYVEEMTWSVDGKAASRCSNITICRHGLVASGIHEITINERSGCNE